MGEDDYRAGLIEGRTVASRSFDDWLMKLSAGALAIALGFVRTSAPAVWVWVLVSSWILFMLGLLTMLVSFRASHAAFDRARRDVDRSGLNPESDWRARPGGAATHLTTVLTWTSFGSFVLGVVALGTFVTANLSNLR